MGDVLLLLLDPYPCRALADLPQAAATQPGPVFCAGQDKAGLIRSFASAACQGDAPHVPPRQIALSDQRPPGPKELLPPLAAPVQATTAPPAARAAASGSCPGGQRRRHGRSRVPHCGRSPSSRHHLCRAGASHCRWPACRRCKPGWESGLPEGPIPHPMNPSRRAQALQWAGRPRSNQQWRQYGCSTPGEVGWVGLAQLPASGQGTSFISPTLFQVLHLGSASR